MLINISDNTANRIQVAGIVLMLLGGGLAAWALGRFEELLNYQRLALLLPLLTSFPMICVEDYRASIEGYWGGRAIGVLLAPPLVALGAVVWYLADASAKA
jgi:hypothetical protein